MEITTICVCVKLLLWDYAIYFGGHNLVCGFESSETYIQVRMSEPSTPNTTSQGFVRVSPSAKTTKCFKRNVEKVCVR